MKKYAISKKIDALDLKYLRKNLQMTQKEFAEFLGISKPTIERWERSKEQIEGPIALLVNALRDNMDWLDSQVVPEKTYPLRLKYMYKSRCCSIIDVDENNQRVKVYNFVNHVMFRAFGVVENPTYEDYISFIKSRCIPETRDKLKLQLEHWGIPFYDPMLIIEKTKGRMAEDDFWIEIER